MGMNRATARPTKRSSTSATTISMLIFNFFDMLSFLEIPFFLSSTAPFYDFSGRSLKHWFKLSAQ